MFGAGEKEKVDEGHAALGKAYPLDRVIDIVGFSRGAATALADRVHRKG